ncbi:serine/threonine protein kinase [Yamadazyma tenuis]|uniref:Kinase-like protein n=1 Tax=Candida tenuis (strain ATCC 10573 / BCRC 21748 / CBS 615 / JCM 9827 / NBRC 10315 / NRRL Y-1498 / VKM Y-70) TaxID=590646 RepID=G3AW16_CANTC|nr:uncharacterized protein CANTEDRAFT_112161 [Yamadazyma tenuis ATCC 10573]XP_006684018.1 kinase-like protein [Yamadazyma tenuis ATCC 10573]EGV66759.1 hypothetical protein CANTEDRAFT_112161 [Yamadazyma tenuis ATCC 10573]EGV66760.1 kinase-like protein [Yamadazyma tenuis ATCC 10573]WEJ95453.1 serine/threonine protein kinase [Yamadazyma tenuis]
MSAKSLPNLVESIKLDSAATPPNSKTDNPKALPREFLPADAGDKSEPSDPEDDSTGKLPQTSGDYKADGKVLYEGANGVIVKGVDKVTNELVVLKTVKKRSSETAPNYQAAVMREYNLLKPLKNKNIITILDLCRNKDTDELYFVLPYYPQGDLLDFLSVLRKNKKTINSNLKDSMFKQIVCGVKYLHQNQVAHRDLKPENFLISDSGDIKISDFGYSIDLKRLDEEFWNSSNPVLICGTNSFKAPEIFQCDKLLKEGESMEKVKQLMDFKALDYWALGIVYIQLYLMIMPWKTADFNDPNFRHYKANFPGSDNLISNLNKDLENSNANYKLNPSLNVFKDLHYGARFYIFKLLHPSNSKRLTAEQLLKSDWMTQSYANPKELLTLKKSI